MSSRYLNLASRFRNLFIDTKSNDLNLNSNSDSDSDGYVHVGEKSLELKENIVVDKPKSIHDSKLYVKYVEIPLCDRSGSHTLETTCTYFAVDGSPRCYVRFNGYL